MNLQIHCRQLRTLRTIRTLPNSPSETCLKPDVSAAAAELTLRRTVQGGQLPFVA